MTAPSLMQIIRENPATYPHADSFTLVTFRKGKAPNKLKNRLQPVYGWAIIQSSSVALVPTLAGVFDSKIITVPFGNSISGNVIPTDNNYVSDRCTKRSSSSEDIIIENGEKGDSSVVVVELNGAQCFNVSSSLSYNNHSIPCSVEYTPLQDSSLPAKLPSNDDKLCGTIFSDPSFLEFCAGMGGQSTACCDDLGCDDNNNNNLNADKAEQKTPEPAIDDYNVRIKRWLAEKEEKEAQFKAGVLSGGNTDLINDVIGYWYENKKPLWVLQSEQDGFAEETTREPKTQEERNRKREKEKRRKERRHQERCEAALKEDGNRVHNSKKDGRKSDTKSIANKGQIIDEEYVRKPKILTVEEELLRNEKRLLEKEKLKEEKKKLSELIDRKRSERKARRERKAAQERNTRGGAYLGDNSKAQTNTTSLSDLPSLPGDSSKTRPAAEVPNNNNNNNSNNNNKVKWGNHSLTTTQEDRVCPSKTEEDNAAVRIYSDDTNKDANNNNNNNENRRSGPARILKRAKDKDKDVLHTI